MMLSIILESTKKKSEKLIENGFGSINIFNDDGIIRGTSSLLNLSYNEPHKQIRFNKGVKTNPHFFCHSTKKKLIYQ